MRFRIFDKEYNVHHYDAEYLIDGNGELFFHDVERQELLSPVGDYFILQYFTGLTDVSRKEIFEGDWVEWEEAGSFGAADKIRKAEVVFSPKLAQFVLDTSGRHLIDDKYGDYRPMHYQEGYKIVEKP